MATITSNEELEARLTELRNKVEEEGDTETTVEVTAVAIGAGLRADDDDRPLEAVVTLVMNGHTFQLPWEAAKNLGVSMIEVSGLVHDVTVLASVLRDTIKLDNREILSFVETFLAATGGRRAGETEAADMATARKEYEEAIAAMLHEPDSAKAAEMLKKMVGEGTLSDMTDSGKSFWQ